MIQPENLINAGYTPQGYPLEYEEYRKKTSLYTIIYFNLAPRWLRIEGYFIDISFPSSGCIEKDEHKAKLFYAIWHL